MTTVAGDDPTPWNLLHDGSIVRLERDLADQVSVWVDAPYVRARFSDGGTLFRLRLAACTEFTYTPFDEPPIIELAAIASSEPSLVEAQLDDGDILVWGSAGSLRMRYTSLVLELDTGTPIPIEELRRVVRSCWDEWRAHWAPTLAHSTIRTVLEGQPLRGALPALLEAWRAERTSELAKAIEIIDERTRGPAPVRLDGPDPFAAWCATWSTEPGAALAELARGVQASHVDAQAGSVVWAGLTRCLGALRDADPDPRIGRAIEEALESPIDARFRIDQVHPMTSFARPDDEPRFPDHALALLELHADGGTAARLDARADRLRGNAPELSDHLDDLATKLRARYSQDRVLSDEVAAALRSRS